MGNIIQDVIPFGGMNTDDDFHLFPEGDYRYAENVRNATSEEGNIGAFENILGNLKISNGNLWNIRTLESSIVIPNTAIHTCIGSCTDITTNCVYYAVHTSPFIKTISQVDYEYVQDAIYEYNKDTGVLTTLLKDGHETIADATVFYEKFLNFSLLHPMNGMFVVDGLLFFNDGYNPPRKINIEKAKNFTKSINTRVDFTDNVYAGGSVGFVVAQTVYDSLSIGDRVQIFQNRGATYSYYDGTATIIDKIIDGTTYVVVINKEFLGNTTNEGGFIYKSYGGYSIPFKEVFMDRIKHPPMFPINAEYGSDANKNFNYVGGNQFQFAYKYVYDDKEESTLSPISAIPLSTVLNTGDISVYNDPKINNVIYINLNTGSNNVKGIKLYTRSTSESKDVNPVTVNCNNSDWWLVDELTKYNDFDSLIIDDDINYVYSFYNSQNKQYGDQTDLNRPFDYVPQICATSEIVENSRIVDGDITEGYDNTGMDASVEYLCENVDSDLGTIVPCVKYPQTGTTYLSYQILPLPLTVQAGDVYNFKIIIDSNPSSYVEENIPFQITSNDLLTYPMSLKKKIFRAFRSRNYPKQYMPDGMPVLISAIIITNSSFPSNDDLVVSGLIGTDGWYALTSSFTDGYSSVVYSSYALSPDYYINAPYNDYQIILQSNAIFMPAYYERYSFNTISTSIQKVNNLYRPNPSFKTQSDNAIGVVYFDRASRSGFVNKIQNLYIPAYREMLDSTGTQITTNQINIGCKITINNTPPTWATHYAIAYSTASNYEYFMQYYVKSFALDGTRTKIDISTIATINTLQGKTIIEPYIYQAGDRVRILTKKDGKTILTAVHDYEIIKADVSYIWIAENITTATDIGTSVAGTKEGWVFEIYRNKKTNKEEIYYTSPYVFPIESGYHVGNTQTQTSSVPCIITAEIGGVYNKFGALTVDGWLENKDAYYFFKSDGINIGRPNISNVNAKQQNLFNHIRFSGQLFQNTQINNLSRNDASDYIQVSSKFGAITKLVEIGYVLKVLQEKNLNSVYLSRTQLTNTDGSTNLSAVNTPLGTINPSESLYGSKYPRSVIRNNRSLYFLDTMQGAFIKDDNNGSEQISETRKMNRFFTDLCRKIESGLYTVVMTGSYDIRHEEAIFNVSLTLIASPYTVTYYTVAYSEIKNKFTTFYTYNTEQLEDIGQQLISFKNGELYLHNKTTNYNEFYGVDYPQKITIVGNKNPKFNKIFTNTAIRTNGEWNVPEMRILPTLNYPIGMKSRLKKAKFVNKEGVQYASFMNDMTDPRYATPTEALINGRPLRGECVEIDYQNESTDKCVTLMFTIGMTNSELGV